MSEWKSKNRHKYLLQYHLILVCKYRKKMMTPKISEDIKQLSFEICKRIGVDIKTMETDKDHIHYMIETNPTMSISKIVNRIKSYTTYHIWRVDSDILKRYIYYDVHKFWTDGYFVCSVGNVSEKQLKIYIENQG